MAMIEENEEPLRKCEWCGKSEISSTWSSWKVLYCSFRCNAAGSYRLLVAISVIASMMTGIVTIIYFMMIGANPTTPIPLELLMFPVILLVFIDMSFIYAAYVGRSMRKERKASLLFLNDFLCKLLGILNIIGVRMFS